MAAQHRAGGRWCLEDLHLELHQAQLVPRLVDNPPGGGGEIQAFKLKGKGLEGEKTTRMNQNMSPAFE